eukprot:TRINITY_DN8536_c0_g1_i2.p1 TRINITY_DN8536_c0_g1~~TRINITY_DN8536_c0_g1_i2.p1  ORF type:complete len:167 (-),score=66.18 TRINITY_DN8536_c0_g1_i2:58-558(-)
MGILNILCLVLLLQVVWVRGEDEVIDEEELAKEEKEGKEGKDIDWAEMLQMGMAIGKSILGEETVEKLKKGDLSELIKVGTKVLGEDTVKDFMNSVTEGAFTPTEGEEHSGDILEDDELGDVLQETSETDENEDTPTEIPVSTIEESSQEEAPTSESVPTKVVDEL